MIVIGVDQESTGIPVNVIEGGVESIPKELNVIPLPDSAMAREVASRVCANGCVSYSPYPIPFVRMSNPEFAA